MLLALLLKVGLAIVLLAVLIGIVRFAWKHKVGIIKLVLGLFLAVILLGILFDPQVRATYGWFAFAAICGFLGWLGLMFIRNL